MAFCINCGQELAEGAKFCYECGADVGTVSTTHTNQRTTVYDGEIHKCPNCGEILSSFISVCPTCGHELRGTKASNSACELAMRLQEIESRRTSKRNTIFGRGFASKQPDDIDEQKINLIKSFAIPNTKEDILEFAVLAASNVDRNAYDESYGYLSQRMNARRRDVSNAWMSKLEQAYQKARIVLAGDPRLNEIQALYESTHKSVNKAKWKTWKFIGLLYGILIGFFVVVFVILSISDSSSEKKEIRRLEEIVEVIEVALGDCDYQYALMNADNLHYTESDANLVKEWAIKREYYIGKVIEEAAKDGVFLEEPGSEEATDDQNNG